MATSDAADIVRDVPDRDRAPALPGAEPVHHRLPARRPAHAAEPSVERLQHDHERERGIDALHEAEAHHQRAREQQAERQEESRIASVRHAAHQKLRKAVGDGEAGQRSAELRLRVLRVFLEDVWHREREILPHEIKARVADEDARENLPAAAACIPHRLRFAGKGAVVGSRLEK